MVKHLFIGFCLLLCACATPEQIAAEKAQQKQADMNSCAGYGFRPNSDAFRNCLLQLDIARQQLYYANYYNDYPAPIFHYGFGYNHR